MELAEARKRAVEAIQKKPDTYLAFSFSYNESVVLPYKEGIALLTLLEKSVFLRETYSGPPKVEPFSSNAVGVKPLTHTEYAQFHMAQLMGISISELIQQNGEAPPPF